METKCVCVCGNFSLIRWSLKSFQFLSCRHKASQKLLKCVCLKSDGLEQGICLSCAHTHAHALPMQGEYIDWTIGVSLGISTMAAAGLGNLISDLAGLGLAHQVEVLYRSLGIPDPHLSPSQRAHRSSKWTGLLVSCCLGNNVLAYVAHASLSLLHPPSLPPSLSPSLPLSLLTPPPPRAAVWVSPLDVS